MPIAAAAYLGLLNRAAGPLAGLADAQASAFLALSALGYSPADPADLADADLVTVTPADLPGLIDIGTWRMLESIVDNLSEGELRQAGIPDDVYKVATRLRLRLERLYARVQRQYGIGLPTLKAGVLDIGGIQVDDDAHRCR